MKTNGLLAAVQAMLAACLCVALLFAAGGCVAQGLPGSSGLGTRYEFERMWPALPQDWYFAHPQSVAVDGQGNVYVANSMFGCIQKLSPTGECLAKWGTKGGGDGQFQWPSGVALDGRGNLYVADTGNHRLQKLGPDGRVLAVWGAEGGAPGQFSWPSAVAVDGRGNVYVADTRNHRIQKFTAGGKFLATWGGQGAERGKLDSPLGVEVDAEGNVYVADTGNRRVQKFSPDGKVMAAWGTSGKEAGRFLQPSGVAVDAAGKVYVTDAKRGALLVFDADGKFLREWGPSRVKIQRMSHPMDVAVDADGRVIVAEEWGYRIRVFDGEGDVLATWGSGGAGPGRFVYPYGIALGPRGQVYVMDSNNRRLEKFSPEGVLLAIVDETGKIDHPTGIAVDDRGQVYVVDTFNNRVRKYDAQGRLISQWGQKGSAPGQFDFPYGCGVAVDGQGNVYVSDRNNHRVQKFTSDGKFLLEWGGKGKEDGRFNTPYGIAAGSSGSVYVADTGNNRIQKFTSEGKFLLKFGGRGAADGRLNADGIMGLAVDGRGRVFVADRSNNRIQIFSAEGKFLGKFCAFGSGRGQLLIPAGVAVDKAGNVYVLDTENNRVQKFRPRKGSAEVIGGGDPPAASRPVPGVAELPLKDKDSVSQYGITWTFEKKRPVGRFVNGDYWVVGPVKIIGIDPPSTDKDGRIMNGSMVNPSPRNSVRQGYDSAMYGKAGASKYYDPKLNVAFEVGPRKPLLVPPRSSLVSTISVAKSVGYHRPPQIQTAAILTVLEKPAPEGSFRPPYSGKNKTPRYNRKDLNWSLLKKLQPVKSTPKWAKVERWFERVWLDHCPQSGGKSRSQHPKTSMPDYSRDMCNQVSEASLMLQLDFPRARKEKLLIRFVQLGIDLYGVVQDGGQDNWPPGGGQSNGRKWPIIFAGLMLGDAGMQHVKMQSAEDGQTYYGRGWTGAQALWGDFHGTESERWRDHEGKHPGQWTVDGRGRAGDPRRGSLSNVRSESYRRCCSSSAWVGEALAARLMDATDQWNHPAFFDYVDRWMTEDDSEYVKIIKEATGRDFSKGYLRQRQTWSPFVNEMWARYRNLPELPAAG